MRLRLLGGLALALAAGCNDGARHVGLGTLAGSQPLGRLYLTPEGRWSSLSFTNDPAPSDTEMTANGVALDRVPIGDGLFAHELTKAPAPGPVTITARSADEISCTFLDLGVQRTYRLTSPADGRVRNGSHAVLDWFPATDVRDDFPPVVALFVYLEDGIESSVPLEEHVNGGRLEIDFPSSFAFIPPGGEIRGYIEVDAVFPRVGQKVGSCADALWLIRVEEPQRFRVPVIWAN